MKTIAIVGGGFAIGDCALVTNARDGKSAPMTAQLREVQCAAGNVLASLAG
jgi:NADH dehydrogenase FAD-containing subunit